MPDDQIANARPDRGALHDGCMAGYVLVCARARVIDKCPTDEGNGGGRGQGRYAQLNNGDEGPQRRHCDPPPPSVDPPGRMGVRFAYARGLCTINGDAGGLGGTHRDEHAPLGTYNIGGPIDEAIGETFSGESFGDALLGEPIESSLSQTHDAFAPCDHTSTYQEVSPRSQQRQEDSVEAWVEDASMTSFELLDCEADGIPSMCYDQDECCGIWNQADTLAYTYADLDLPLPPTPHSEFSVDKEAATTPPLPPPPPPAIAPFSHSLPNLKVGSVFSDVADVSNCGPTRCMYGRSFPTPVRPAKPFQPKRVIGIPYPAAAKEKPGLVPTKSIKKSTTCHGRRGKPLPISVEDLAAVYHLPREQAASFLRIGCTFLKKICRTYGIRRWPSRKLAALTNHIEELGLLAAQYGPDYNPDHMSGLFAKLQEAIAHAEASKRNIYADPNFAIARDLYRELHNFRKQCQLE